MEIPQSPEVEFLRKKNMHLLSENVKLRRMLRPMHENLEPQWGPKNFKTQDSMFCPFKKEGEHHKDHKKLQGCHGTADEIAFQLDRIILSFTSLIRKQLYVLIESSTHEEIQQDTSCQLTNSVDDFLQRSDKERHYTEIMNRLKKYEDILSEYLVEPCVKDQPQSDISELVSLRKLAAEAKHTDILKDVYILVNNLTHFAKEEVKPLFIP
ncbi:uncharacterized protein LOC128635916 [Bombina bombina]|uniref:uncharacterized protein LOC128635916 n=1 Tax=Bombina bombina TaxID=8345 RepID=UPI00235A8622|nr:uncharacterized protein LOC128635916 [Bombina bombina]